MTKVLWLVVMIIGSLFSILSIVIYDNYFFSSILILLVFSICFFLSNSNNKVKNFINLQSFFLLGFLLFFLGRMIAVLFNRNIGSSLFCIDFIFDYCEEGDGVLYLVFIINLILISFASAFVFSFNTGRHSSKSTIVIDCKHVSKNKFFVIYLIGLLSLISVIFSTLDTVYLAINSGYMALYANQAESYTPPFFLLVSTISIASMAVIYSVREQFRPIYFKFIFSIFILSMLLSVLTGSRSSFISGILLIVWHFYKNKSISFIRYLAISAAGLILIYFLDTIAALSGARPHDANGSFLKTLSETFYNQGITLMVFNSSINVESYPVLGYLKTLFPGVQVLFSQFGVTERYDFDWSSFMTYHENSEAYAAGFGLGWSIFSDFYVLSFGFLPIFCLLVFLLGKFVITVNNTESQFRIGLLFICILSFFSIVRSSISPLIFTIIIYLIFSLYIRTLYFKRKSWMK